MKIKTILQIVGSLLLATSCSDQNNVKLQSELTDIANNRITNTSLIVLGTTQDAGSPQIECKKECCLDLYKHPDKKRRVVALGLIDSENNKSYLFEASPDIAMQLHQLKSLSQNKKNEFVEGIFISHAHIGHYSGLMYLGKEAMDSKNIKLFGMPRMADFLEKNGPWNQLVERNNIAITLMENEKIIELSNNIQVRPIIVPHRDEYSETVAFKINGPNKSALFIPDIDKWSKWNKNILEEIVKVDYAFLDATFYDAKEINNRDISQIPHPFVIESVELFKDLNINEKSKIIFIHFNHTNPLLNPNSKETLFVLSHGFRIARINDIYEL